MRKINIKTIGDGNHVTTLRGNLCFIRHLYNKPPARTLVEENQITTVYGLSIPDIKNQRHSRITKADEKVDKTIYVFSTKGCSILTKGLKKSQNVNLTVRNVDDKNRYTGYSNPNYDIYYKHVNTATILTTGPKMA